MNCSGAGVVPIIIKNNKIYIITFIDRYGLASDAGGKVDNEGEYKCDSKIVEKTALRELFEESSGLIKLSDLEESISYDIKNKNNFYRCFFVKINKINFKNFDKNLNKFNEYKLNPFNEMYSIKLLDMKTIKFDKKDIFIDTITGETEKICHRLKFILYQIITKYKSFENFYESLTIKKYKLKKNIININSKEYKTNKQFTITDIISYQS
jgi:hypothetical protein